MAIRYLSGINVDSNTLFVDDSNNWVGIGTASPSWALDVVGDGVFSGTVGIGTATPGQTLDVNGSGRFYNSSVNGSGMLIDTSTANLVNLSPSYPGAWYATDVHIQSSTTGGLNAGVYIKSGGNVGIGTTSPSYKLDVSGDSRTTGTILTSNGTLGTVQYGASSYNIQGGSSVGDLRYTAPRHRWYEDATFVMTIDGGNVGIGTTSPGAKLEVVGDTYLRTQVFTDTIRPYSGNQLTLLNGGSNYLYINGNVGIGTTSPSVPLHVIGNTLITGRLDFTNANVHVQRNVNELQLGAYSGWRFYDMQGTSTRMFLTQTGNLGIGTTSPDGKLHLATSGEVKLDLQDTGGQQYRLFTRSSDNVFGLYDVTQARTWFRYTGNATASSTKLSLLEGGGNVGIGTTSPSYKLDVSGEVRVNNNWLRTSYIRSSGGGANDLLLQADSGQLIFKTNGANERMRIDAAGNVGIGTTGPAFTNGSGLEIEKSGIATLRLQSAGSHASEINQSTTELSIADLSSGVMVFKTNGSERMRISSGNVGIGTTSPAQKLHVEGSVLIDAFNAGNETGIFFREGFYNYNASILAYDHNGGGTTPDGISVNGYDGVSFCTGSNTRNERMRIAQGGNVGIGTTSPSEKLDVVGKILAQSSSYVHVRVDQTDSGMIDMGMTSGTAEGFLNVQNTGAGHVATPPEFKLLLNSSEKMRVDENGDVGIGETSVDARLHITTSSSGLVNQKFESAGSAAWRVGIPAGQTYFAFDNANDNLSAPKVIINSSGNVGIGTTSPAASLHIEKTGDQASSVKGMVLSSGAAGTNKYLPSITWSYGASGTPDFARLEAQRGGGVSGRMLFSVANSSGTMTEAMRIDDAARVGIGTTIPADSLHVNGGGILNVGTTNTYAIHMNADSGSGPILTFGNSTDYDAYGAIKHGSSQFQFLSVNRDYNFLNNGSSLMLIDVSTGRVGINTTAPSYTLDVVGDFRAQDRSNQLVFAEHGTQTVAELKIIADTAHDAALYFGDAVDSVRAGFYYDVSANQLQFRGYDNGNRMVISSNGAVGIGTTSPARKLQVGDGSADDRIRVYFSDGTYSEQTGYGMEFARAASYLRPTGNASKIMYFGAVSNNWNGLYSYSSNGFFWNNASTEHMRISSAGNVGINTTSPSYKLDVNGTFRGGGFIADNSTFTLTFNSVNVLYGNLSYGALPAAATFGTGDSGIVSDFPGSEVMRIASLGRVGINTTSPQANLHLNGSLRVDAPSYFANIAAGLRADPGNGILGNDPAGLGQDQDILGTPDTWLAVNINGTDYAIPAFAP